MNYPEFPDSLTALPELEIMKILCPLFFSIILSSTTLADHHDCPFYHDYTDVNVSGLDFAEVLQVLYKAVATSERGVEIPEKQIRKETARRILEGGFQHAPGTEAIYEVQFINSLAFYLTFRMNGLLYTSLFDGFMGKPYAALELLCEHFHNGQHIPQPEPIQVNPDLLPANEGALALPDTDPMKSWL